MYMYSPQHKIILSDACYENIHANFPLALDVHEQLNAHQTLDFNELNSPN